MKPHNKHITFYISKLLRLFLGAISITCYVDVLIALYNDQYNLSEYADLACKSGTVFALLITGSIVIKVLGETFFNPPFKLKDND